MKIINQFDNNAVEIATDYLNEGKIICFPTDTIYGLAVDATNEKAVEKLYNFKNRPKNKPFSIFIRDINIAKKLFVFNNYSLDIAKKFFPGQLTMILKTNNYAKKILAKNINNGINDFVGFRIVDSYFVRNLLQKNSKILAVSSANKSFEDPCLSAFAIKQNLQGIDLLIVGKKTSGIASTIIKIDGDSLSVIRNGKLKF